MDTKKLQEIYTSSTEIMANYIADMKTASPGRIWGGILTGIKATFMGIRGAKERINQTVLSWPGVTTHRHRYGGTEWRLGRREIGHIHGDYLVDIPFPKKVRDALVSAGEAEPHHILPDSGWISHYLRQPEDVAHALTLLNRSFELATAQRARRRAKSES